MFFHFMSNLTQTKQKNKIESKECVRTVLNNKKEIYTKDWNPHPHIPSTP